MIHGAFTAEQWAALQEQFTLPQASPCTGACIDQAPFGQQLFFEPMLSGPWVKDAGGVKLYPANKTSCSTCHDAAPTKDAGWYIDTRAGATSMGAEKLTKHNTITLVNVFYGKTKFTWSGQYTDPTTMLAHDCAAPSDVVEHIALPAAMSSDVDVLARVINNVPSYRATYRQLFPYATGTDLMKNVEAVFDSYMKKLVSVNAPFDKFIRGDDDAISESAQRGFALFVGRAMCVECHSGPFFSDEKFRATGVIDAKLDGGRDGTGKFYTAGLRNIAETGPYMHNGTLNTLADVIWFYRQGGMASGFAHPENKDPLMQKLDISDDDAADLEAFLRTLTGTAITMDLRTDTHVPRVIPQSPMQCQIPTSSNTGLVCNGVCSDIKNDVANCGGCGLDCGANSYCMGGICGP